ncbi:MAG TPA: hypothetical protein PKN81_14270 [Anaerolineales bacterium]|nr:hypothetical protein [Anaerolineales bacterium]HNB87962.1 hypothetical protein [Anaerolineales bacterium]HNO86492.1 hypothetical protein [Anaerolineales bacterium]HUM27397.1 hypothetical protein [Anaerolineales bacterium]
MPEEINAAQKPWYERFLEYVIGLLLLASLTYGISHSSFRRKIDKDEIAQKVLENCKYHSFMYMQEEPLQANAELMTCSEVQIKTEMNECDNRNPDMKVWFVATDGLWFLYGPVVGNGDLPPPILINSCHALVDARNGMILETGYSKFKK